MRSRFVYGFFCGPMKESIATVVVVFYCCCCFRLLFCLYIGIDRKRKGEKEDWPRIECHQTEVSVKQLQRLVSA